MPGSLFELAGKLALAARSIEVDMERGHAFKKASEILETAMKGAIGTYTYDWPALAPSTLSRKAGDTPLFETGAYKASFTHILGEHQAWIGSSDPKIHWFESGTSKMPPRPVLRPTWEAKKHEVQGCFSEVLHHAIIGR